MPAPAVTLSRLQEADLDLLEPLWNALREHHAARAEHFGPPRDRADSWAVRRRQYEAWLGRDDSFALIARIAERPVGYAMVIVKDDPSPIWPGGRSGSLETLSVLPDARGARIGTELISQARAELAAHGITHMSIDVLATNDDALRFYARHGFQPGVATLFGSTV